MKKNYIKCLMVIIASIIMAGCANAASNNISKENIEDYSYGYEDDMRFQYGVYIHDETFINQLEDVYRNINTYKGKTMYINGIVKNIKEDRFDLIRYYDVNKCNSEDHNHDKIESSHENCDSQESRAMIGITVLCDTSNINEGAWVEVSGEIKYENNGVEDTPFLYMNTIEEKEEHGQEVVYRRGPSLVE